MAVIRVTGLKEFRAAVAKASDAKPAEMRKGLNEVAGVIVRNVVPEMRSQFVSSPERLTGKLENSVRGLSTTKEGRVAAGYTTRVPYAGWWEFGGSTKRKAGGMNRPFLKRGRTLYPTLDKHEADVVAAMEHVLDRLANLILHGGV